MTSDAIEFLRWLHGDAAVNLVALKGRDSRHAQFSTADEAGIDKWIKAWNPTHGLYVTIATPKPTWGGGKHAQPSKCDIAGSDKAWADVDPPKPGKDEPEMTPEELDEWRKDALHLLRNPVGIPAPTRIVDSGRGYWGFWKLDKTVGPEELEAINRGLVAKLGSDSVSDASRITRLVGTKNHKRNAGMARVVEDNGTVHKAADFPHVEAPEATNAPDLDIGAPITIEDASELDRHAKCQDEKDRAALLTAKIIMGQGEDPWHPKPGDSSRSIWVFQFCCTMARLGVPNEVTLGVLLDKGWGISESIYDQAKRTPDEYARRQIARAHAKVARDEPGRVNTAEAVEAATPVEMTSITPIPPDLPRRPWLAEGLLMDGQITMLSGKGGEGKSLLALQLAIMVAAHVDFAYWQARQRRNVLILNAEDDMDEQRRRVAGACGSMQIDPRLLDDRLFLLGHTSLVLVHRDPEDGKVKPTPLFYSVQKAIKERDIGMIVLDPLVETHVGLDENSNTDMKDLIVHLRSLARGKAIPILAVHHSRKGATAGDQDGARGGSAMVNACRVVMTVERMSEKEHDDIIKPPRDKEAYVRIVGSKTNYSGRIGDRWMEFDIVDLDCGDEAPALRRKTFGSLGDGFDPTTWEHRDALLKLVRDGRPNGGGGWSTGKRGPKETRLDVAVCDLGLDKGEAGKVIEAFEAAGSIERRKVNDSNRHLKEVWALAQEGAGEPDPEIPF